MKQILYILAVLALVTFSTSADAQRSGRQDRAFVQIEGEGGAAVVAPIDNKGNAKIDNVKPGNHQVALLVPAVQKVRGAAAQEASKGHEKWIDIESYSWGVSQMGSAGLGGGGGAGKVNVQDISVMKKTDKATPELFQSAVAKPVQAPLVNTVKKGEQEYYKIELENIMVSSYQPSGGSGGDRPMESLSLNFSKLKWDIKEIKK